MEARPCVLQAIYINPINIEVLPLRGCPQTRVNLFVGLCPTEF